MQTLRINKKHSLPFRRVKIFEDYSRVLEFLRSVAPDIEVLVSEVIAVAGVVDPGRSCAAGSTDSRCGYSASRLLEPGILIGRVIDYQFGNDAQIARMCSVQERAEIVERAEIRIDVEIIGNVVAVVAQGRRIERQQPDRSDP